MSNHSQSIRNSIMIQFNSVQFLVNGYITNKKRIKDLLTVSKDASTATPARFVNDGCIRACLVAQMHSHHLAIRIGRGEWTMRVCPKVIGVVVRADKGILGSAEQQEGCLMAWNSRAVLVLGSISAICRLSNSSLWSSHVHVSVVHTSGST